MGTVTRHHVRPPSMRTVIFAGWRTSAASFRRCAASLRLWKSMGCFARTWAMGTSDLGAGRSKAKIVV